MNDDFFSAFRESPRSEFTESLYHRLMQDTNTRRAIYRNPTVKRVSLAFLALVAVFAFTLAVSPAARAAVDELITTIIVRGTTVFVSSDEPDYSTLPEEFESYSVIWKPITPEKIASDYAFFAKLPAWVPSGYVLQDRAALNYPVIYGEPSFALFQWKNDAGDMIQLEVNKGSCPHGPFYESGAPRSDCTLSSLLSVGAESEPQVIAVHDQPGVLIGVAFGFADLSGSAEWNPYRGKMSKDPAQGASMIWEDDGRTFLLSAGSATVTKQELIRLAESIP